MVVEQMEEVFLRGYRDTLQSAHVAPPPRRDPVDALPEPARAMSLCDIYRLKREMDQPIPPEPSLDEVDRERIDREAVVGGQVVRQQVGMPRRGPRR